MEAVTAMIDSDALIQFVRVRLDEDEQIAQAAEGDRWVMNAGGDGDAEVYDPTTGDAIAGASIDNRLSEDTAAHIARWDPHRGLLVIRAMRMLLEVWGYGAGTNVHTIRVLALIWDDHPDYDPEWAFPKPVDG